ncbi:hypothetical protein K440DRAFT_667901 [Wilcoxina mikolae CBS 423.85]|nr:hypothetical protein K440DRAFT_667901 [Wilcoxina mikolae CBS 423.85]
MAVFAQLVRIIRGIRYTFSISLPQDTRYWGLEKNSMFSLESTYQFSNQRRRRPSHLPHRRPTSTGTDLIPAWLEPKVLIGNLIVQHSLKRQCILRRRIHDPKMDTMKSGTRSGRVKRTRYSELGESLLGNQSILDETVSQIVYVAFQTVQAVSGSMCGEVALKASILRHGPPISIYYSPQSPVPATHFLSDTNKVFRVRR